MDDDTFWAVIEECRQESRNDTELTTRVLFRRLRVLEAAEVIEFVRIWERARSGLYSWPVTDAACLLLGLVEDEDLRQVQDWIISYGGRRSSGSRVIRTAWQILPATRATPAQTGSTSSPPRHTSS